MEQFRLFIEYLKQREGVEAVVKDYGFATFLIRGPEIYLKDIYIDETVRQKGLAAKLADEIAEIGRQKGCLFMTGTVCPAAKNSTTSLKVLLGYGMELYSSQDNLIIFKKDL